MRVSRQRLLSLGAATAAAALQAVAGQTTCDASYYLAADGTCELCPLGVNCVEGDGVGATLATLDLLPGYWRTDAGSERVLECWNTEACLGGTDPDAYCEEGYTGPYCAVCEDDYYPSGNYICMSCETGNSVHAILTIVIFVGVVIFFIVLVKMASSGVEHAAGQRDDGISDAAANAANMRALNAAGGGGGGLVGLAATLRKHADTLIVKFKILVAHFQVVSQFPQVLDVEWPESFSRYADKFSIFNLDIWALFSQGCFFSHSFWGELLSATLLPIGIILALFAHYMYKRRKVSTAEKQRMWAGTLAGVLLTTFFFYIIASTVVLKTFDCDELDTGNFLKADYTISCTSNRYKVYRVYAGVMVVLFPLGIPLLYLLLLWRDRRHINPDPDFPETSLEMREADPTIKKTSFLWAAYLPSVYWYEVWECVRKLLMTGLLVYFKQGTSSQVVIAIIITLGAMRMLAGFAPFKRPDENSLAEAALWVTFLTLFVGLLISSGVDEEDGYNTEALGVILSVMNIALIGLAVLQVLWQCSVWAHETMVAIAECLCCCCGGGGSASRKRRQQAQTAKQQWPPSGSRPPSDTQSRPTSGVYVGNPVQAAPAQRPAGPQSSAGQARGPRPLPAQPVPAQPPVYSDSATAAVAPAPVGRSAAHARQPTAEAGPRPRSHHHVPNRSSGDASLLLIASEGEAGGGGGGHVRGPSSGHARGPSGGHVRGPSGGSTQGGHTRGGSGGSTIV